MFAPGLSSFFVGASASEGLPLQNVPDIIVGNASVLVSQLSVASEHTCALSTAGGVYCWGDNSAGQLGIGSTSQPPANWPAGADPVDLGGMTVVRVFAEYQATCVLADTGAVHCWGEGGARFTSRGGQVYGASSLAPVRNAPALPLHSDWSVLVLTSGFMLQMQSEQFACVAHGDGNVQCWGENRACVLGLSGTESDMTVHYVAGDADLTDAALTLGSLALPPPAPTPTCTSSPSPSASVSGTPSPSASVSGTSSPSVSASVSGTPSPSVSASVSGTPSPSVSASVSGTPSPSPPASSSPSPSSSPEATFLGTGLSPGSDNQSGNSTGSGAADLRGASSSTADSSHDFNGAAIAGTVVVVALVGSIAFGAVYVVKLMKVKVPKLSSPPSVA